MPESWSDDVPLHTAGAWWGHRYAAKLRSGEFMARRLPLNEMKRRAGGGAEGRVPSAEFPHARQVPAQKERDSARIRNLPRDAFEDEESARSRNPDKDREGVGRDDSSKHHILYCGKMLSVKDLNRLVVEFGGKNPRPVARCIH